MPRRTVGAMRERQWRRLDPAQPAKEVIFGLQMNCLTVAWTAVKIRRSPGKSTISLQRLVPMCYKRIMRDWVREKLMRRRKKPVANNSESTGKIGHEIPQDQPTPLQPSYPQPLEREDTAKVPARADRAEATPVADAPQAASSGGADEKRSGRNWRNRHGNRSAGQASGGREPKEEPQSSGESSIPEQNQNLVMETQPESLSQPPTELQASKSPKGYVVLTIGLPGSGKTTWFKRRGVTPLSSDMLRSILFDDITEQRYQGLVFSTLRSLLRARLIAKMPWNYVDATNLSPHERRQWIKMARSFGYEVHAVFFDVPFEVCMERNMRRDYMVNEAAMRSMAERLRPPSFKEGFHKITVVRVKSNAESSPDAAIPMA
jgi:predicted kinase